MVTKTFFINRQLGPCSYLHHVAYVLYEMMTPLTRRSLLHLCKHADTHSILGANLNIFVVSAFFPNCLFSFHGDGITIGICHSLSNHLTLNDIVSLLSLSRHHLETRVFFTLRLFCFWSFFVLYFGFVSEQFTNCHVPINAKSNRKRAEAEAKIIANELRMAVVALSIAAANI